MTHVKFSASCRQCALIYELAWLAITRSFDVVATLIGLKSFLFWNHILWHKKFFLELTISLKIFVGDSKLMFFHRVVSFGSTGGATSGFSFGAAKPEAATEKPAAPTYSFGGDKGKSNLSCSNFFYDSLIFLELAAYSQVRRKRPSLVRQFGTPIKIINLIKKKYSGSLWYWETYFIKILFAHLILSIKYYFFTQRAI